MTDDTPRFHGRVSASDAEGRGPGQTLGRFRRQRRHRPGFVEPDGLCEDRLRWIHRSMRHVLRTAVERKTDPENMPASWLTPRRQQGAECPRCGGTIATARVAGRSAYFCPQHQGR